MTHGDKAKAKAAKSNKASVKKAGPKGGENGKSKAAGQAVKGQGKAVQGGKTSQSSGKGSKAGEGAKAGAEAAAVKKGSGQAKDSTSRAEPKAKSSAAPADTAGSFSNPAISAAFRQALKKYPNALRKLTD